MLRLMRIRNLALIRDLQIEFGRGLNLLTGETGSGKSILVDALGLLLGKRSSQEMIRSDCDSAVLEGLFEIEDGGPVSQMLAESGFEVEDNSLLIRREISSSGRNRVFINSHLANLSVLKSLGERLADIHGQQDQKSLLDLPTHLQWLDYFGGNAEQVNDIQARFRRIRAIAEQLDAMETNEQERLRHIDILRFQIEEIRRVNPEPSEKEELETERLILSNREKILTLASEAYSILYESDSSILRGISRLQRILEELAEFDKRWAQYRESVQDSSYKLEDLAYAVRDFSVDSDFSPEKLEQVHQRLHALDNLTKKYGSSISAVLEYLAGCERQLEEVVSYSESSGRLSEQLTKELKSYQEAADKLSLKRRRDAERLQREIRKEFAALAMERMEMRVRIQPRQDSDDATRYPGSYGLNGIDNVEFLIAPNTGEEMMPLAKIASGGELSRLMLSIKSLCGSDERGRTLVFDEVDAGIGGRVAEAVGKRLSEISANNQVLCVTHLPQIAAFADSHFSVQKTIVDGRTETMVKSLAPSERVDEMSRMLAGETITETTRRHALEMLAHSRASRQESGGSNTI
jgi:DNA repair protein RecN (Recombination protein N)